MPSHWVKEQNIWALCEKRCYICCSDVTLHYSNIRTIRQKNSLRLQLDNKVNPIKKFIPEFQIKGFEELLKDFEKTDEDIIDNNKSVMKTIYDHEDVPDIVSLRI